MWFLFYKCFKNLFILKKAAFLILSLSFVSLSLWAQCASDCEKLINEKIWAVSTKNDSDVVWVIAGENQDKIFRIKNNKYKDITEEAQLPKGNKYTSILCLSNRHVLLGTENNYLYYLKGKKKYIWINQSYGLQENHIESLALRKKDKMVFISTPNSRYMLKHYNRTYNFRLVQIKDTEKTIDELAYFFKYFVKGPVQEGICFLTSDIDLSFRKDKYISDETLNNLKSQLTPGDIIIKRNDMQLANVGIPGFWTHSGIYIGSLNQLDSCYNDLPMLDSQLPSEYIKENFPEVYNVLKDKNHQIIEAISEGVVINSVEHIAKVDYLADLRPNLSKETVFQSIIAAFEFYGTPYDFLFDFENDDALVCSELVYHAFKETKNKKGIQFIFGKLNGRRFVSPNDIAHQYAIERYTRNPQFTLVHFYDADEKKKKSVKRNERAFARSWNRKFR